MTKRRLPSFPLLVNVLYGNRKGKFKRKAYKLMNHEFLDYLISMAETTDQYVHRSDQIMTRLDLLDTLVLNHPLAYLRSDEPDDDKALFEADMVLFASYAIYCYLLYAPKPKRILGKSNRRDYRDYLGSTLISVESILNKLEKEIEEAKSWIAKDASVALLGMKYEFIKLNNCIALQVEEQKFTRQVVRQIKPYLKYRFGSKKVNQMIRDAAAGLKSGDIATQDIKELLKL